ncbi:TPM domain-containing protein [Hyphomicrobium sp.]|uniref:TPM domain-containing protein n=1 Tax=Hyphomicrobium sp. TaxID=82 RepID=UPI003F6F7D5E
MPFAPSGSLSSRGAGWGEAAPSPSIKNENTAPIVLSKKRHATARLAAATCVALATVVLAFAFLGLGPALAAPTFPSLTGQIVDTANLLTPEDRAAVEGELKVLEEKSTDQFVVVTVPSLEGYEIEDYGYQLGRHWGIGQAGKDNGVLLIVAPNERKVRIEVGRGLEPIVTDLMSRIIIENAILPEFRRGNFSGGIRAGVRDIKDTLLGDAEAVKERARGLNGNDEPDWIGLLMIAFWIAVVVYIIYAQSRYAAQSPQTVGRDPQRRGRRGGAPIIIPGGASDSWGGGWSGGGGGGWSGGGGDFGGGGGSGSW